MKTVLRALVSGETVNYQFDFTSMLGIGETISTSTAAASVYTGTGTLTLGTATASGSIVTVPISGGTVGSIYIVVVTITTSGNQTLKISGFITVTPSAV